MKNKSMTRRGILSILSSAYDPVSFGGPFFLKGLQILQMKCGQSLKWDKALPYDIVTE